MNEIKEMFLNLKTHMITIEKKIDNNNEELKKLTHENKQLKKKINEQEERLDMLEREIRKNNIVIQGIGEEKDETIDELKVKVEEMLEKANIKIDMNSEVSEINRIGTNAGNSKRPVLMKLMSNNKKMEILRNAKCLKGTTVWINEDYPKKVQIKRKTLLQHLKLARQKGSRAYLRYDKLIIDGKTYKVEDCDGDEISESEEIAELKVVDNRAGIKRTTSERSPENENTTEHLKKITRNKATKN